MATLLTDQLHEAKTTGDIARLYTARGYPLKVWQVRRIYEAGILPEPERRAGTYRLIPPEDLPALEAALQRAGYLPAAVTMAHALTPATR